ncbi:MAG: sugar phosphate isomerase/epimerase family protein [Eubacteriales bacterium]|nr:sugar phosphate isomerase/epimerase family protein [Eubacteriales bacterium]
MKLLMETYNLARTYGIKEALRMLHDAGFDAADVSLYRLAPEEDMLNRPDRCAYARSVREYADSLGVSLLQAHSPFDMKYGEPFDMSNKAYADIVYSLEVCSVLGIPHTVVHAVKTPREDCSVDYKEYNRAFYLSLLLYCEKYGVKIAVENLFWHDKKRECFFGLFPTPAEMTDFVDSLGSPWFTVCLDMGHTAITGLDPETYILGMDKRHLGALHVQDTDFLGDRHFLPYSGKHNWDAVCRALAKIDYCGDFTLEILHFIDKYPPELLPAALEFACHVGHSLIDKVEKYRAEAAAPAADA